MTDILKDADIDRLASELAGLTNESKTEAVRHALERAVQRETARRQFIERGLAFSAALRERASRFDPNAADKAFIDSLYED